MEGKSRFVNMEYEAQVAPFVAKTYEMVNDRRTDEWIRWGKENNSFLVLDPVEFSQLLLPCYFKHKNFSSFVRQLNTYGFRKVDPDRWEFAHESFLRGETRLLALISRRRNNNNNNNGGGGSSSYHSNSSGNNYLSVVKDIVGEEEMEEEMLIQELRRLRQEQKALEEELQGMDRRLQATEMRPRKMMSFLAKVVEDPDLLSRLMVSKKQEFISKKKRRIVISPPPPPPPPVTVQGLVYSPLETLNASCEVDAGGKIHAAQQLSVIGMDPNTSQSQIKLVSEFELNYEPNSMAAKEVPFPFSILGHFFF